MPPSAAVLDASVLISGFLTEGPPRTILALAEAGRFRMVLSAVILEETRRTLVKPKLLQAYRHSAEAIGTFCDGMADAALLVEGDPAFVSPCRDPNDHHVVATAVAAAAPVIVTGDKDLLDLGQYAASASLPRAGSWTTWPRCDCDTDVSGRPALFGADIVA